MQTKLSTFLWFQSNATAAAELYCSIFPDATILDRTPGGVTFEIGSQRIIAFNGGAHYALTPAVSLMVAVATQAEIDALWERFMTAGATPSRCGWLVDPYGLSWQIIPAHLPALLASPKALQAMLQMEKLDIAALEAAAQS